MNDYSSEIITELLQRTAVVAVAALLIAGLLSVVRPASARIHRLLWCLVLLQGWMFLQYQLPIPWYETPPVIETEKEHVASASPVVEINAPTLEEETVDLVLENDPSTRSSPATLPVAATKTENQNTELSNSPITISSPATVYWPAVLVGVWITGMLLIVARWLFGTIRFVRSVPKAEGPDDRLRVRWDELLKKHGVKQTIELRMSESLGPMLCRLPRGYTLFLPQQFWNGLSELEQTVVLEHELSHYLRRDVWKSLFVRLLALPHWFNPCAWWAVRRFDQCAEWACDATAQHLEPEQRISYAKTLMRLVEQSGTAQPCRPALFGSSVLFRVKRLLSPQPPEDTKMKKLVLCSLVLLLIAFSLIRPQLVAQTPAPTETTKIGQSKEIQSGETEVVRLPESLSAVQANKQPAVPREKLRYDGKSFEQWKELLETELKPERRAEAMKAFGIFGLHGYSEEAARSIVEVTRDYDFRILYGQNHESGGLQAASIRAFRRAASPAAMKILSEELKSGKPNRQWFALMVLQPAGDSHGWYDPLADQKKFNEQAKLTVPTLLVLISNENTDSGVRMFAISRIQVFDPQVESFASRLRQIMQDENPRIALAACSALVKVDPETEGLVEKLVQLAGKDDQRISALYALRDLGPKAKAAIPGLLQILEEKPVKKKITPGPGDGLVFVVLQEQAEAPENALAAIGAEAMEPLIEAYKKSENFQKFRILVIFKKMGPKAKPALPFLTQEYIVKTDATLMLRIQEAVESIISDKAESRRLFRKLHEMKKSQEEKKKAQDRELDGVGVPIKPLLR
ncbi:MAG: hypothetical protein IH899_12935 [Planctomycetes bacterium]|nr:hypothetical protein [Planctomycetota bacterium]